MNPEKPILIVEDEIFVALDIERILCEQGYSVAAIAADRNEALAAVDHAQIAFVDINLRDGMTGPEIAADLARKGVKVIYVTANPAQIDPPAETAIGFIRKPFSDQSILAAAALGYGRIDHARAAEADVTVFGP